MQLPLLKNARVEGKRVFVRADLDVPLREFKVQSSKFKVEIGDETRLKAALPTIEYLLKQKAKVVIGGHIGRPRPAKSLELRTENLNKELSLVPVARWFGNKFKVQSSKFKVEKSGFSGWKIGENVFILENLRFYKEELDNDLDFSKRLSNLADIYVNDAFATCHRNHASVVGIPRFLPHFAGFHLEDEISTLTKVMESPKRPLVVIVGGKKLDTKLPLIEKMHRIADYVLVGGKVAQSTKTLVKVQHEKVKPLVNGRKSILLVADANSEKSDITSQDAENFLQVINIAKTIIWNGTMGIVNSSKSKVKSSKLDSERGTRMIMNGIVKSEAYSVVGGGDTVEYLNRLGVLHKFSFASTGGGAMLTFLSGEKLPGIEVMLK
jgi:phosphoglycerate kinase